MVVLSKVKAALELFEEDVKDIKEKCEKQDHPGLREDLAKYYCQTADLYNALLPKDQVDYSQIHFKNLKALEKSPIFNRAQVMQRFISRQQRLLKSFGTVIGDLSSIFSPKNGKVYLSDDIPEILMTGMELWDFTDKACRVEKAERKIEKCRQALMALCSSVQRKLINASKIKNASRRKQEENKIAMEYKLAQQKLNGKIKHHSVQLLELGRNPSPVISKRATI